MSHNAAPVEQNDQVPETGGRGKTALVCILLVVLLLLSGWIILRIERGKMQEKEVEHAKSSWTQWPT